MSAENCIFCRIVRGEIPAERVYEDDEILVFPDIQPKAPVHLLVIPKAHVETLYDAAPGHEKALGRMLSKAGELARARGAVDGFRAIINNGRVGHQEVYHVHMHILGGPEPLGRMLSARVASK
jgi:histidine triad (HIT) family protein